VAHNLRPLEAVLEGPMLQQWQTRAEDVKVGRCMLTLSNPH